MCENNFLKHKIFLSVVFILGNTVIVFPKGIGIKYAIPALLLSVLPTIILYLFNGKLNLEQSETSPIFKVCAIIFAFTIFIITERDYINFIDEMHLRDTPRIIISVVFILLCILPALLKEKVLYLFSLYVFGAGALIFITVLIFSLNKINFSDITFSGINIKLTWRQALTFFIHSFGQIIILKFFFNGRENSKTNKIIGVSLFLSYILIFIYVINIIAVLGVTITESVKYPYIKTANAVSFGKNFCGLDGLVYYLYFYSVFIKNSVTVKAIFNLIKFNKKITAVILTVMFSILCNIGYIQNLLHSDVANLIILIFEFIFPISALIYCKIKSLRKL